MNHQRSNERISNVMYRMSVSYTHLDVYKRQVHVGYQIKETINQNLIVVFSFGNFQIYNTENRKSGL